MWMPRKLGGLFGERIIIHIHWQSFLKIGCWSRNADGDVWMLPVQTSAAEVWMPMFELVAFKHQHVQTLARSNFGCRSLNAEVWMLFKLWLFILWQLKVGRGQSFSGCRSTDEYVWLYAPDYLLMWWESYNLLIVTIRGLNNGQIWNLASNKNLTYEVEAGTDSDICRHQWPLVSIMAASCRDW